MNGEVLGALHQLSDESVDFTMFTALDSLPPFNPDHDVEPPASSVAEWRSALRHADAVIICSPEYAHGVPGALKNALDWTVSSGEFVHKPVALCNASASSLFVGPQLTETLTVMMANVVPEANITLALAGRKRDSLAMRMDREIAAQLEGVLSALTRAVDAARASDTPTG